MSEKKWSKKLASTRFPEPVPCPYACSNKFNTSLSLVRHVLRDHNFSNPNRKAVMRSEVEINTKLEEISVFNKAITPKDVNLFSWHSITYAMTSLMWALGRLEVFPLDELIKLIKKDGLKDGS